MEKSKQITHQDNQTGTTPAMFWGTIALGVIGIVAVLFTLVPMLQLPREGVVYFAMVLYTLTIVAGMTVIILTLRGRQDLGAQLAFYMVVLVFMSSPVIFVGRALTAFSSLLAISGIVILQLLPRALRRRYIAIAGGALILIWAVEWINPSWRLQTEVGRGGGPVTATVFGLILGVILVREAWARNNIRSRFLTLSLGLTLVATLMVALISVNSFFSAGQQQQKIASNILRDQIQNTLGHQTVEVAIKNDVILQSIGQDALDVAQQAAYIFENPSAFTSETFWKADDHMFLGPQGQYINGKNDVSTVFIPNTVQVDDNLKHQLERLAYLDMALAPAFKDNPNVTAIYFVGKDEISWLYPNINLGAIVAPDYLATQDIFYSVGSPENNPDRKVVWTPVYDDPAGQGILVSAIAPVYARNQFMGIIGIDVSLAGLTEAIETEDFGVGEGVYALLVDNSGKALALPEQGYRDLLGREREPGEFGVDLVASARPEFAPLLETIRSGETDSQSVFVGDQEFFVAYTPLSTTNWYLVSIANTAQVLAPAASLETTLQGLTNSLVYQRITPVGIGLMVVVLLAGIFFTSRLVKPIEQLTEGASKIGGGEWDASLPESGLVEIDKLSNTLSAMARQLKGTLESLEQRVADRTHNLELAAEVGRTVSQVRALDVMLRDACELILKEFNLYYVQVYLTDPSQTNLILEAGTGDVGTQLLERSHSLQLNTGSINGRAAIEKRSVVISDTTQSSTFRQNPLLPDTRGEMAVPLIVANKVVGVLDMQSSSPGVLNDEVLPAFEALAGQLAVAIQNANLLAETEQARAEVEKQARRLVRTSWSEHLDAIHKPEHIGFVFDHDQVSPLMDVEASQLPENEKTVSASISVTGESLGSLVMEFGDESKREQASELVGVVARQVAQQIENLRLLESAERYRVEAEQAVRRQTRENWQSYFQAEHSNTLSYLYDQNEVRPFNNDDEPNENVYTLPLKVRDETIGKLAIQELGSDDHESIDLINAVADRLTAHIEGLRQSDQTQSALTQSETLFDASRNLTQATDLQQLVSTAVSTVKIPEINRAILVAFNYNESDSVESLDVIANWWNGTGNQATPIGTHYPLEVIRVMQMFISPTPVFFDDTFTDKRVDATTMQLVQRLNLRAVAVLPLHLGTGQIGALILEAEVPHHFTSEETRLFIAIAPQIATIMDNRRQFEETKRGQVELDKRARQLAAVAEVSSVSSRELDIQKMLETVVSLTQRKFGLYHAHVFLYNEKADELKIAACGWKEGDEHEGTHGTTSIPFSQEQSLVARAARTQKAIIVNDVHNEPGWLPNPMLPDTASELAVPLLIGDRVLGVLDVQADHVNAFTEEDANIQTTLASQVATALQNARSFTQAQKQAERETMLNVINQKIQSATSVEAVLQIAARELGHALGAPMTIAQLSMKDKSS